MRLGVDDWIDMKLTHVENSEPIRDTNEEREKALRQAVQLARTTVFYADPFFVSAEMCDLVAAAADTFKLEPLLPADLLSPCGFLLFEKPIQLWAGQPGDQVQMFYAGFSWIGVSKEEGTPPFAVALTTYNDWLAYDLKALEGKKDELPDVHDLELWQFDQLPETSHCSWWRLAQTTLRLMLEFKPASRYKAKPDRASRRDARRSGFEQREVTVVRLRRERTLSEQLGGVANYSCRFMVSGHWRNQWCPTLGRHRQTWIAPYVKGPDDKPFKPTRGRAFTFTR